MSVKPGETVTISFTTQDPSDGSATDADSTPTGTLVRNGSDTAETVTINNIETGVYTAQVTIPAGYSEGDEVELRISATVSTTTGKEIVWSRTLVSKRVSELNDVSDTSVADQVWDEAKADHTSTGSFGEEVQDHALSSEVATAANVWGYSSRTLTQSAASVESAVSGDEIAVYRGATWNISLTGLGDISTYDTIYFSVKYYFSDSDDDAILRVSNTNGLERFNKAAVSNSSDGSLTIDDASAGNITIKVDASVTKDASIQQELQYDVKGVDNDGDVDLISIGEEQFEIDGDVTRAVS